MAKTIKRICWITGKMGAKLLALSCLVVFFLCLIFIWRVSKEPYDVSFVKDYIETAMRDNATGNYAKMGKAVLFWPNLRGPLYLQLYDGQLFNKDDVMILSVEQVDVSFSRRGLLKGRIMPKAIILKEPTLRMTRNEQGEINFDIGDDADADKDSQVALTTRVFGYIARPGYESAHDSLIGRLRAFTIEDANLLVDDRIAKQTWALPDFDLKMVSTQSGMDGKISVELPQTGLVQSKLDINMNYLWDQRNVELSADVKSINLKDIIGKIPKLKIPGTQNMVIDAHVETILDETFSPSDVRVNITSDSGDILHPALSDTPIAYKNLALNATYNYAGKTLLVKDTTVTLNDITVSAGAKITHTQDTIKGPVNIWIDEVTQEKIAAIWPKFLDGEGAQEWIVDKMSDGTFKNVRAQLNVLGTKQLATEGSAGEWSFDAQDLVAEFAAEDMSVDYRAPLQKASHVYGNGRFDLAQDSLDIKVQKGSIGDMRISDSTLFFDQIIAEGVGDADIRVNLKGDVADVIRYVSVEPIDLGDKIGLDVNKVKGNANLKINLLFPARNTVKIEDFKIGVSGALDKLLLPSVIEELDLSGGSLNFAVQDGKVSMKGKAQLDNRPMDFAWETFLDSEGKPYKEKISAKITADPNLRSQLGVDLSDFIEGSLPIDVSYTLFRDGTAQADINVDATPALFFVAPFDYEKPPGQKAQAKFKAFFKNRKIQKITKLTAQGDDFSLAESHIDFVQSDGDTWLKSGTFPKFRLLETKGALNFSFDKERTVDINMKASFLDAQPFMDAEENVGEYNEPRMRITSTADVMRTAPNETVTHVRTYVDIDSKGRFNEMEMDAHAGQSDVFVRFNEGADGKRTFRLKTEDAGALLKAFQIHNDMRGGTMVIYGEPIRGVHDRNLRGKAEITDVRVVKAPSLTKILSILSLTGIGDALSDNGLKFKKMEVDFSWLFRKNGSLLVLKNGRTSGNSLGLLFEGTFDNEKRYVDVSGTVVPMDGLNRIIGKIPLVGDILTGGSGGVFAATYSVKGPSENPVISANPLSVLTPGILRRILWE